MMRIRTLEESGAHDAWDAFVRAHPQGSFAHLSRWSHVMERGLGYRTLYLVAEEAGEIVSVLPSAYLDLWPFRKVLHSLPVLSTAGALGNRLPNHIDYLRERTNFRALQIEQRATLRDGELESAAEHVVDLGGGPHGILARFKKGKRRSVRRAAELGYRLEETREPGAASRFYGIYASAMRDFGTPPLSLRFFEAIRDCLGEAATFFFVHEADTLLASSLCIRCGSEYGSLFAVLDRTRIVDHPHLATYFEYLKMLHAEKEGCKRYSIGRSARGSSQARAKSELGATENPLERVLLRLVDSRIHRQTGPNPRLFARVWRHLPLRATTVLGPTLRRLFA